MRKNILKNQKGVTLIVLILVIIILSILLGVAVQNIDIGEDIRNYNYMYADIELLESKIMIYYNQYGTIPTTGTAIDASTMLDGQESTRDNANYYQIDLSKLYNITLNYGGGTLEDKDIYIVNEQSHEVYYLKGAYYEDSLYHTEMSHKGEWVIIKEATCTETGSRTRTCTECGIQETKTIEKLAHNYVDGTCTMCGEKVE